MFSLVLLIKGINCSDTATCDRVFSMQKVPWIFAFLDGKVEYKLIFSPPFT